jgi:arylsulfatase A-like enzyme
MAEKETQPELAYRPGPRESTWDVLIVVIDDLRADSLSLHGYERRTSPFLDARAASGTVFFDCHSPVGWTLPGCASIVTGQLPEDHGLWDHNQKFRKPKLGHYLGSGYHRVAVTNNGNVVSDEIPREYLERLGFKRRPAKWRFFHWNDGFDRYEWISRDDHQRPFDLAAELITERNREASLSSARGSEVRPWFLFFHTNWVHDYHMDRPYYLDVEEWIGEPVHPSLRSVKDGPEVWQEPPAGVSRARVLRDMRAKYDCGVRTLDRRLDGLLALVDFDRTIVVVMSDHGEGFDPARGRVHHCGRLHTDLTHVPLVIWLPPELRARANPPPRISEPCSTIDVVPTILALLGDAIADFPGQHLFDLSPHRRLVGSDRGYVYWNEDCIRESYDTARIEIRSERCYPLQRIDVWKNDSLKEFAYNLAYDPLEHDNLLAAPRPPIPGFEPITFIVAVNDHDELRHNLLASPVAKSPHHQWLLVDNTGNGRYGGISPLYQDALAHAENDLVFFVHQDVYLPHGWEERVFQGLVALETRDPRWGVIGAVGALAPTRSVAKQLRGHWCDPSGYHRLGPLPHEVQSLDEQWLGFRKSTGIGFDPELPGFHCYGIDLSLIALELGRKTWAIDAFVWHKYRDSKGYLISRREESEKIVERWTPKFMEQFQPCAEWVERKWKKHLPFQTTSWNWGEP